MRRRNISRALPLLNGFCIFGGLLFARLNSTPVVRRRKPQVTGMAQSHDLDPMGKGQAPGMATGLGVCGAGRSEAGWADEPSGAERRVRTAGFFLAAFFLADFLVGFFLAALRVAAFRACFAGAFPPGLRARFESALVPLPRTCGFADLRAAFFLGPADFFAARLRPAFALAIA